VFACAPDIFDLDADGEKKRWREQLVCYIREIRGICALNIRRYSVCHMGYVAHL